MLKEPCLIRKRREMIRGVFSIQLGARNSAVVWIYPVDLVLGVRDTVYLGQDERTKHTRLVKAISMRAQCSDWT
jgi:hypothetical protein